MSKWEKERKDRRSNGGERGWEEELGSEEEYERLERKDRKKQKRERAERIRDLRYNSWYKDVKTEGVPRYLTAGWREERWRRVARFRLGNELNGRRYWEEEGGRMCRICGEEEETWGHVIERCKGGVRPERASGEKIRTILGERGEWESGMKELERAKERRNERMNGVKGTEAEVRERREGEYRGVEVRGTVDRRQLYTHKDERQDRRTNRRLWERETSRKEQRQRRTKRPTEAHTTTLIDTRIHGIHPRHNE